MFEEVYRFIAGRIRFTAREGFQETFLNACKAEKTALEQVNVTDTQITASVNYRDYGKILRAAGQSGMVLEPVKKSGLPALLVRYKKRIGIPIGLFLAAVVITILSSTLWSIEITGLETINEYDFTAYLEKKGIKTGGFLSDVDCNEIEAIAENYGENVLRVTANLMGCRLLIHVQEREIPLDIPGARRYCNIVAAKDGEILKADIFAGEARVKPGDAVLRGDLLADGLTATPGGKPRCVEAEARILARTRAGITCQTAARITIQKVTAVNNRYALSFFGLTLPGLGERISGARYMRSDAGVFPVGLLRRADTQTEEETIDLSPDASFLICVTDLAVAAAGQLRDVRITECDVHIQNDMQICVDAAFYCEEDIARKEYFELKDIK